MKSRFDEMFSRNCRDDICRYKVSSQNILAGNRDARWCWLAYDIRRILLLLVSLDARRRKENFCFLNYMRPVEICILHGPLDDDERHPMRFGLHKVQEGCHSFPLKSRSV